MRELFSSKEGLAVLENGLYIIFSTAILLMVCLRQGKATNKTRYSYVRIASAL